MLLFAISCSKEPEVENYDEYPISEEVETSKEVSFLRLNFSQETYLNHYLNNKSERGDIDEENYIPTYEMLVEVVELLEADDAEQPFLDDFLENHGSFEWNYSFMKKQDDLCFISIPMLKSDQLSGVLKFYKKGDEAAIRFVSKSVTDEIVSTPQFSGDLELLKGAIIDLIAFEVNIHQTINHDYFEWLRRNELTSGESSRGEFWCIWEVEYNYILGATVVEPDGFTTYYYYLQTVYNFECFHQTNLGGFPNDYIPTNGGVGVGNSSTNIDNANTETPTPQENCVEAMGLAAQVYVNELRDLNLPFYCEESIDVIIDRILTNMIETGQCQGLGSLTDFQNEFASVDCINSIFPISCESYEFEDLGLFYLSRLEGTEPLFANDDGVVVSCPFDYEIFAPEILFVSTGGSDLTGHTITPGMMANAAAEAHNEAIVEVVGDYGSQYSSNLLALPCSDLENSFITEFNNNFGIALSQVVIEYYNISNVTSFEFEVDPEANLGFDPTYTVEPTQRESDITAIVGEAGVDDCID